MRLFFMFLARKLSISQQQQIIYMQFFVKNPVNYFFFSSTGLKYKFFRLCVDFWACEVRCSNLLWIYKQGKTVEQLQNEDQQKYLDEECKSCFYSPSPPYNFKLSFWSFAVWYVLNLCLANSWSFMTFCVTTCRILSRFWICDYLLW